MTLNDLKEKICSPLVWGNCLGLVIVTTGLLLAASFYLDSYTLHGEVLSMPDVKGKDVSVAVRKLEAEGLRAEVSDTGYVANLPANVILDQSIQAGREVKPGRLVQLTINSTNSPMIVMPDLADNCSLREAEMKLKTLGFKIGVAERVPGDLDWVVGVKVNGRPVASGSRVPAGAAVTLVVGEGYGDDSFENTEDQSGSLNNDTENSPVDTPAETLSLDAIGV